MNKNSRTVSRRHFNIHYNNSPCIVKKKFRALAAALPHRVVCRIRKSEILASSAFQLKQKHYTPTNFHT
ncbi:MAG: hypothetical protein LUC19_00080, partial [Oscillospiraceae bacterium]|nr:hypothetical protein [Oscillospiraceae bacterium]